MHAFFRHPLVSMALAVTALSVVGCATATDATSPATATAAPSAVMTALTQDPELSTFARLIQAAGLGDSIASSGTVFAPTDDAFKAVPAATLDKLSKDPEQLKAVLSYHVVPGKIVSTSVEGSMPTTTLNGAKLGLSRAGDFVTVDDGMVIKADMMAGDSIIHKIDRVLMPAVKK